MAEELGERSEAPTGKRLSDARQKGQVVKSQDLSGVVELFGSVVLLIIFGGLITATSAGLMRRYLGADPAGADLTVHTIAFSARHAFGQAGLMLLPCLGVAAGVAFIAQFVQVGWMVTPEPIRPKLTRLDPIQGFTRVFGKKGVVKTAVNTLKLTAVLSIAAVVVVSKTETIAALPMLISTAAVYATLEIMLELVFILLAVMLVIGVIDYLAQRWQHTQNLKMTKQEVKDERRSMDGDPQIKGKRLQMARQIAMQRVGKAVPEADVIITNPTHFSVAIKYDTEVMGAPRVTAKGADEIALRIRQLARRHGVTIVERPPLARALYWGVEVGREISAEHYEAVAEVLAYVYRLEARPLSRPENRLTPAR